MSIGCTDRNALRPVICLDSGIGGLHIFHALSDLIPVPLLYIADHAGFPYGMRSTEHLCQRLCELIHKLDQQIRPSIIVLACNTATTVAISTLRTTFPYLTFVGCVPAVKPAASASQNHCIAVLATPATIHQPALDTLIKDHAGECRVLRFPLEKLAELAEHYFLSPASITIEDVRDAILPLLHHPEANHIDHVVLGCTHYRFLLPLLKTLGQPHWTWIDSTEAVARQAYQKWQQHHTTYTTSSAQPSGLTRSFFYTLENNVGLAYHVSLTSGLKRLGLEDTIPKPWHWKTDSLEESVLSSYATAENMSLHTL